MLVAYVLEQYGDVLKLFRAFAARDAEESKRLKAAGEKATYARQNWFRAVLGQAGKRLALAPVYTETEDGLTMAMVQTYPDVKLGVTKAGKDDPDGPLTAHGYTLTIGRGDDALEKALAALEKAAKRAAKAGAAWSAVEASAREGFDAATR